jgi:hypothetical protein
LEPCAVRARLDRIEIRQVKPALNSRASRLNLQKRRAVRRMALRSGISWRVPWGQRNSN